MNWSIFTIIQLNGDDAVHWRYSSARDYVGQEGLVSVCRVW